MNFESWLRRNYVFVILFLLGTYIFFSFAAPILMRFGKVKASKSIYWIYSNICHQYPYRSWFLFGKQAYYPLSHVNNPEFETFSKAFVLSEQAAKNPRIIIGNMRTGYKLAFCQRDLALYSTFFLFGLVFSIFGRKFKRIPFLIWLFIGILPFSIDGVTQLLGSYEVNIPFIGIWESTPLIRTITGSLFGIFTGWYIFPSLEQLFNPELFQVRGRWS